MNIRTKSTKDKWNQIIKLFYKLIESKKPLSIIQNKEIVSYVNKNLKYGRTISKDTNINIRQLRYLVFKRKSEHHTEYIYVRRSQKDIANQIMNFKSFSR